MRCTSEVIGWIDLEDAADVARLPGEEPYQVVSVFIGNLHELTQELEVEWRWLQELVG
jgi:hypothetical protein